MAGYSNFGFGFRLHFIRRFVCFFNENVIVIFAEILDNRLLISGRDAFFGVCCFRRFCIIFIDGDSLFDRLRAAYVRGCL